MVDFQFLVDESDARALLGALEGRGWLACSTEWNSTPFEFEGTPPSRFFEGSWDGQILVIFKDNIPIITIPVKAVHIKRIDKIDYVLGTMGGPFAYLRTTPSLVYKEPLMACGTLSIWMQSGFFHPISNHTLDESEFSGVLSEDIYDICGECISITVDRQHWFISDKSKILENPDDWVDRISGKTISSALKRYRR